jgi:hypothetical protein
VLAIPSLMSPLLYIFLRDVWIRTQRATIAGHSNNLATHLEECFLKKSVSMWLKLSAKTVIKCIGYQLKLYFPVPKLKIRFSACTFPLRIRKN